jgi:hypothetical protein
MQDTGANWLLNNGLNCGCRMLTRITNRATGKILHLINCFNSFALEKNNFLCWSKDRTIVKKLIFQNRSTKSAALVSVLVSFCEIDLFIKKFTLPTIKQTFRISSHWYWTTPRMFANWNTKLNFELALLAIYFGEILYLCLLYVCAYCICAE